jgi:hypothetical protein
LHESDPLVPEKSERQEDEEAQERFADESPAEDPSPELIEGGDPEDSPEHPNDEALGDANGSRSS